jgi:hypothetical protein
MIQDIYGSSYSPEEFIKQTLGRVEANRANVSRETGQRQELPSWAQYFTTRGTSAPEEFDVSRPGDADLVSGAQRYQTNQALADVLGNEPEPERGLLESVFGLLDKPRAIVMSAGKELADAIGGGGEASWDDFTRQIDEGYGFGDTEILQFQEDDTGWERALKGAGAFVGDVALDPITYVTFGTAGVARKAAGEAVFAASRAASKQAADAAAKEAAGEIGEAGAKQATKSANKLIDDAINIDLNRKAEEVTSLGPSRMSEVDKIAGRATEQWYKGGSRALKDFYKAQFGEEQGTMLFNQLPDMAKGGMGFWVPFTNIKLGSFGGGGAITDLTGMGKITGSIYESINRFRNKMRTTDIPVLNVGGKFLNNLGADSKEYSTFLKELLDETIEEPVRFTYAKYMKNKEALKNLNDLRSQLGKSAALVLADLSVADDATRKEVDNLFSNPEAYKVALETKPNDKSTLITTKIIEERDKIYQEAVRRGIDIGFIEDYATFYLRDEALRLKKKGRKVKGARLSFGSPLTKEGQKLADEARVVSGVEAEATKGRLSFVKFKTDANGNYVLDADGNPMKEGYYNPFEINEQLSKLGLDEIAETDAGNIFARYVDVFTSAIAYRSFADDLAQFDLVKRGGQAPNPLIARISESGAEAISAAVRRASDAGEIQKDVAKFFEDPENITGYFSNNIDLSDTNSYDKISRLMNALIVREQGILKRLEDSRDLPGKFSKEREDLISQKNKQINKLENSIKSIKNKVSEKPATKVERQRLRDSLKISQVNIKKLQNEKENVEKNIDSLSKVTDEIKEVSNNINTITKDLSTVTDKVQRQRLRSSLTILQKDISRLQNQRKEIESNLSKNSLSKLDDEIKKLQNKINSINSKIEKEALDASNRQKIKNIEREIEEIINERDNEKFTLGEKYDSALKQVDEEAIEQTRKRMEDLRSAFGEETTQLDDVLRSEGLRQFAQGRKDVFVPEPFANVFGSDVVISGLERMFKQSSKEEGALAVIGNAITEYMRFFRTGATVGRGTGFVARNGIGAAWQNIIAGVKMSDNVATTKAMNFMVRKDFAVNSLQSMTPDVVRGALRTLKNKDLIDDDTLTLANLDLDANGFLSFQRINEINERLIETGLRQIKIKGTKDATYYDVYKVSVDTGVFDETVVLQQFAGDQANASVRRLSQEFGRQPSKRQYVAPDKAKEELNAFEKVADGILNIGVDVKLPNDRLLSLRPTDLTIRFNNRTEQAVRMAVITAGIRMYGGDEVGQSLAGLLMKGVHFDYQDLSDFERNVMRNILPFWTWTRNNVPLQFRAILMNPGKVNTLLRGWETINNVMADENGDVYFTPDWVRERFGFVSMLSSGENPLMISLESPLTDINKLFRDPRQAGVTGILNVNELLTGASPLIKTPTEIITDQNLFTGAPYSDKGRELPAFMRPIAEATGMNVPLIGFTNQEGQPVIEEQWYQAFKNLVPSVGVPERLVPQVFGSEAMEERQLSSALSNLAGLPFATMTPSQELGELRGRNIDLEEQNQRDAAAAGLDYSQLREAAKYYTRDQIREFIAMGYYRL